MFKSKFTNLKFNEKKHSYEVDGTLYPAVSNVVKKFYPQFDVEFKATQVAMRTGESIDSIIEKWKLNGEQAAKYGTNVHAFGERFVLHKFFDEEFNESLVPSNGKEKAIVRYIDRLKPNILPVGVEVRMYSNNFGFAGTADLLLFNSTTGKFIIGDYKTNKQMYNSYNEFMNPPFEYMPSNNFNHYQLQLSMYQLALEEAGYKIEDRYLIWLKEDGCFEILHTADFTNILKKEL